MESSSVIDGSWIRKMRHMNSKRTTELTSVELMLDSARKIQLEPTVIRFIKEWNPSHGDIPVEFRIHPRRSMHLCPRCEGKAHYRSDERFQNELRCPKCEVTWNPAEVEFMQGCIKAYELEEKTK